MLTHFFVRGSITVLTSCFTGWDSTKQVKMLKNCNIKKQLKAESKPVKQEVSSTLMFPLMN